MGSSRTLTAARAKRHRASETLAMGARRQLLQPARVVEAKPPEAMKRPQEMRWVSARPPPGLRHVQGQAAGMCRREVRSPLSLGDASLVSGDSVAAAGVIHRSDNPEDWTLGAVYGGRST